jgi:cell division protein FtsB
MWTPWRYLKLRTENMAEDIKGLQDEVAEIKATGEAVVSEVAGLHGKISELEVALAAAGANEGAVAAAVAGLKASANNMRAAIAKATSASPAFPEAPSASEDPHTAA